MSHTGAIELICKNLLLISMKKEISVPRGVKIFMIKTHKVLNIENRNSENVYNMVVDDVHCFAVGKTKNIVSNCDALRYGVMYIYKSQNSDVSKAAINIGL